MMDPRQAVRDVVDREIFGPFSIDRVTRAILAALGIPENVRVLPTEHGLLYMRECEECDGTGHWVDGDISDVSEAVFVENGCLAGCDKGWIISAPTQTIDQAIATAVARQGVTPPSVGTFAVIELPEEQENSDG